MKPKPERQEARKQESKKAILLALSLISSLPCSFSRSLAFSLFSLFFRVKPYQKALIQRTDFVSHQKSLGITSVTVTPLENPPTSILFLDITTDPDHWINQLQAEWYGVEKIEVRDEW